MQVRAFERYISLNKNSPWGSFKATFDSLPQWYIPSLCLVPGLQKRFSEQSLKQNKMYQF